MEENLKTKIHNILNPEPIGLFSEKDIITLEISNFIHQEHSNPAGIRKLLLPAQDLRHRHQLVERQCVCCNEKYIVEYSCSDLTDFLIKPEKCPFWCKKCKKLQEQQQKEREKQLLQKRLENIKQLTEEYITIYLSPNHSWEPNVKTTNKISSLYQNVDYDVVATHIQNMDYSDFLKTPYWVAVAEKTKNINSWCCEMCGKRTKNIHIHHPNYDFHGYELQNIRKLKCLCAECHEKFHNVGE